MEKGNYSHVLEAATHKKQAASNAEAEAKAEAEGEPEHDQPDQTQGQS